MPIRQFDYDVLVLGGVGVDTIVRVPELRIPDGGLLVVPPVHDYVELNARRPDDHCLCGGAISRLRGRGAASASFTPRSMISGSARAWAGLADELGCTPSRLTRLRTARLADMELAVRVTRWLSRPAAACIHPAQW
ncbi:MAG TPA: hypothetical protein VH372_24380 [Actinospica sp.]|nr:hypothetical protein [Actinospica sp.]